MSILSHHGSSSSLSSRLNRALARLAADARMDSGCVRAAAAAVGETVAEALSSGATVNLSGKPGSPAVPIFETGQPEERELLADFASAPYSGSILVGRPSGRNYAPEEIEFGSLAARQLERACAAAELAAANRRYRAFLANSSESIGRIEFDQPIPLDEPEEEIIENVYARGYVAECNDAFARQRGFASAADTLGKRLPVVRDRHIHEHHREDRAVARARFRVSNAPSITRRDGAAPRYFLNNMTGDFENGLIARFWAVGRDITDQKAAENAERELRQRFATLVNTLDGIVWIADPAFETFTFVSEQAERLLGFPCSQWTSETGFWSARLHPEDRDWVRQSRLDAVARGEGEAVEYRMVDASGRTVWMKDSFTLVRRGRSIQFAQGVMFDIGHDKAMEDTLRALAAKSIAVREEERTRIAHEIHDELGQQLTILKFDLASLAASLRKDGAEPRVAEVGKITQNVDAAVKTVRRIATELRPSVLDHFGVAAAIEFQSREFQQRTGIACKASRLDEVTLDQNIATTVFRIFQEALTNVARHAEAQAVDVSLIAQEGNLTLTVKDDGRGFAPRRDAGTKSLGMVGMKERARSVGGRLAVESSPGRGTRVIGWFPLEPPR